MTPPARAARRRPSALITVIGGLLLVLAARWSRQRDRGLSQSTENAILLAGAVAVAGIVVTVITAYVRSHLP